MSSQRHGRAEVEKDELFTCSIQHNPSGHHASPARSTQKQTRRRSKKDESNEVVSRELPGHAKKKRCTWRAARRKDNATECVKILKAMSNSKLYINEWTSQKSVYDPRLGTRFRRMVKNWRRGLKERVKKSASVTVTVTVLVDIAAEKKKDGNAARTRNTAGWDLDNRIGVPYRVDPHINLRLQVDKRKEQGANFCICSILLVPNEKKPRAEFEQTREKPEVRRLSRAIHFFLRNNNVNRGRWIFSRGLRASVSAEEN